MEFQVYLYKKSYLTVIVVKTGSVFRIFISINYQTGNLYPEDARTQNITLFNVAITDFHVPL